MSAVLPAQTAEEDWIARHYLLQERLVDGLVFDILQDRQGFMWFGTEFGLVKYDGHSLKTYRHAPDDEFSLADNVVTSLAEDQAGNLWVGTMNAGLHYFDRRLERFQRYLYDANNPGSIGNNKVNEILVRRNGEVWITTEGGGAQLFDPKNGAFRRFQKPLLSSNYCDALLETSDGNFWAGSFFGLNRWMEVSGRFVLTDSLPEMPGEPKVVKALAEDRRGHLWLGMRNGGLYRADKGTRALSKVVLSPGKDQESKQNHIWDLLAGDQNGIWAGTEGGLFYIEEFENGIRQKISPFSLGEAKRALSLCKSRDGVIWVGTNSGVLVLAPRYKAFQHIRPILPGEPAATKRGVTFMSPAPDGRIWAGANRGLFQFDPVSLHFHQDFLQTFPQLKPFKEENIACVFTDRPGNLWITTISGFNTGFGVYCFTAGRRLLDFSGRCLPFRSHVTFSITEDDRGDLWFANGSGLVRYQVASDSLHEYYHDPARPESPGSNFASRVLFSRKNGLWIGSNDAGLDRFDPHNASFRHYPPVQGDTNTLSGKRVLHLFEDGGGLLWLGTNAGLSVFDPQAGKFRNFNLPEGRVNGILPDLRGNLWISTQHALARFSLRDKKFVYFTKDDGIRETEFWDRSCIRDEAGRLYFGGDHGVEIFHPDSIGSNPFVPPVVFTNFLLFNKAVKPDPESKLLPAHPNLAQKIVLRPRQNVFTIHFAALGYISPKKTQFSIKMEGFEADWQAIGNRTEATYTNLYPGSYTFRVRAANNDGLWNNEGLSLGVVVLPPWWRTWWAVGLFTLLLATAALGLHRFQINRRLAEAEAVRLRELDEFKTRFYTNITHEFRTPLTLILGPVERALKHFLPLEAPDLQLVRSNGKRLLRLVNQMLDLSKIDAGHLKIHPVRDDVMVFLRYLAESFHSAAEDKNIHIEFQTEPSRLFLSFDKEKMTGIVGNLLSNAIKFTPEGGRVMVKVNGRPLSGSSGADYWLEIQVADTGPGIPPNWLPHIFDRFYTGGGQGDEGAGIGLALARELVEFMNGRLSVKCEVGEGTVFSVLLPLAGAPGGEPGEGSPALAIEQENLRTPSPAETLPEPFDQPSQMPIVLIIEDNADVARFIAGSLKGGYLTTFAANGKAGFEKAAELIPDIIISDVMMPEMDGFEATALLKNDERTSHIPIILLTARADKPSRLTGISRGADVYLEKPFNEEELLIHIRKLLELRRRLQSYYLRQAGLKSDPAPRETEMENAFLKKVRTAFEPCLDDPRFSLESLARMVGMSHSQLHRKIVALTGRSSQKFIRAIRLQKGKELLRNPDLTIAEIAYLTGFSEPGYFTKVFSKETGVTPTEWRQNPPMP